MLVNRFIEMYYNIFVFIENPYSTHSGSNTINRERRKSYVID